MNSKSQMKSLLLGVILGAGVVIWIGAAADGSNTVWEYKVVSGVTHPTRDLPNLENLINRSVSEGWEFVSASGTSRDAGLAVLRRPRK